LVRFDELSLPETGGRERGRRVEEDALYRSETSADIEAEATVRRGSVEDAMTQTSRSALLIARGTDRANPEANTTAAHKTDESGQ